MELYYKRSLSFQLQRGKEEYWQGAVLVLVFIGEVSLDGQSAFYIRTPIRVMS